MEPTSLVTLRRIASIVAVGCLTAAAVVTVGFLAGLVQLRAARRGEASPGLPVASRQPVVEDREAGVEVRAARKTIRNDVRIYNGEVDIHFATLRIACQHAELSARDGRVLLVGSGGVTIRGLPGFGDRTTADQFRLHGDRGELVLAGDVHLADGTAPVRCRLVTVTLQGKVLGTRSLLDDFAESTEVDRRLALLDDIQAIHAEEELPPAACYLLAMRFLMPHLSWRPALTGSSPAVGPVERPGGAADDPWRLGEAHPGEPWMHAGPHRSEFWWFKDRGHVDVAHAVRLLRREAADAEDLLRRRHWLVEIQRNNTVLLLSGPASFRRGSRMEVALDVRNADRLALRLYRGSGLGSKDSLPDDACPIYVWHADVADLKTAPAATQPDAQAKPASCWRCGRILEVPAKAIEKPGPYLLAVQANGQTAFMPLVVE